VAPRHDPGGVAASPDAGPPTDFRRDALNDAVDAQAPGSAPAGEAEEFPAGFVLDHEWDVDTLDGLADLRQAVARRVTEVLPDDVDRGSGDAPSAMDHMLLVATELASNAIRHGRPPVLLRLHLPTSGVPVREVVVETVDHDTRRLPQFVEGGHRDGGRGMLLAARLALEVSWRTTATTKHVWARLKTDQLRQAEG